MPPVRPESPAEEARRIKLRVKKGSAALRFLRAGRATHPDEAEVQAEYATMTRAVQSGKNIPAATKLAKSHLVAHLTALRPRMRGTVRDPYPGQPEKNVKAVLGFTGVLTELAKRRRQILRIREGL